MRGLGYELVTDDVLPINAFGLRLGARCVAVLRRLKLQKDLIDQFCIKPTNQLSERNLDRRQIFGSPAFVAD